MKMRVPSLLRTVSLGAAQIVAWGASYFFVAVIADPVAADTGWSRQWIFGSLSISILVSGLLAPVVARLISLYGGRAVLATGAVCIAVGLLTMGLAHNLPVFLLAWVIVGVGMAAGLYDALFSSLGQIYGESARGVITQVTLISGFSTTLCWPLTAILVHHLGWRGACFFYAATLIGTILPVYLFSLPSPVGGLVENAIVSGGSKEVASAVETRAFVLLAAAFTLAAVIMTAISVQLIVLLQSQGLSTRAAIGLGALIGPSQVGARGIEIFFGRNRHPVWSLLASTLLVAIGLLILLMGVPRIAAAGIVIYGAGSGIRSIVRGTVPLAMFGRGDYVVVMGRIARPVLVVQAITPLMVGYLLDVHGPKVTSTAICILAALNIPLVWALIPYARCKSARSSWRAAC
jgi:MFS family permease